MPPPSCVGLPVAMGQAYPGGLRKGPWAWEGCRLGSARHTETRLVLWVLTSLLAGKENGSMAKYVSLLITEKYSKYELSTTQVSLPPAC